MSENIVEVEVTGGKIKVRRLGIFELENVESNIPGVFTYEVTIGDEKHRAIYDRSKLKKIPEEPTNLNPEKNTKEYGELIQYNLYIASIAHDEERKEKRYEYYRKVIKYILDYALVSRVDENKIITEEDADKVYKIALVPRLTKEILAHTLRETYKASYDNQEIFDAMETLKGGLGMYDAISLWENKVMLQLQMTEIEYSTLPILERSRKVCALILEDMMEQLDLDRDRKEIDGKS